MGVHDGSIDNKYYTPTIEEFHVGFEYEEEKQKGVQGNPYYEWEKVVIYNDFSTSQNWEGSITDVLYLLENDKIRVKYLDKEDIESLGFKKNTWSDYTGDIYTLDRFILFYNKNTKVLKITDKNRNRETKCGYFHYQLFEGEVKNKSELKVLLKQLGVNEEYYTYIL